MTLAPENQAVIFDWNGTIPDDSFLFCEATNKILLLLGASPVAIDPYREAYDVPVNNMYRAFGCSEESMAEHRQEMVEVWRDHYEANVASVQLRDGVKDMLAEISARGHRLTVLSNYVRESIAAQAGALGIAEYFDAILARPHADLKDVMHSKGKGDRLHAYVRENKVQQAIIVGDSPEEMEIARAFGCVSVGISGGCCSEARIRSAKPDYFVHHVKEIPPIVRHEFKNRRGA
ncbi:MAG: HAD family hydrolase [Bdellovibrionales bacterium]